MNEILIMVTPTLIFLDIMFAYWWIKYGSERLSKRIRYKAYCKYYDKKIQVE